jgi:ribonuclease HI
VYSIFVEEDNIPLEQIDLDNGMWHMHFDGSCCSKGNRAGIIVRVTFLIGWSFSCTNNVIKFESLLLGIENTYNLGCGHLSVFGDFELVVNLVRKISLLATS